MKLLYSRLLTPSNAQLTLPRLGQGFYSAALISLGHQGLDMNMALTEKHHGWPSYRRQSLPPPRSNFHIARVADGEIFLMHALGSRTGSYGAGAK